MKTIKSLSALLLITLSFNAWSHSCWDKFEILMGTWQVENKQQFEKWEKGENNQLIGTVYALKDDKKIIKETLTLFKDGKKIIYQPIVLNQNNGKPVDFVYNQNNKEVLSFENKKHDFPQKIQYRVINEGELMVHVLGADDKGFSYKMIKK